LDVDLRCNDSTGGVAEFYGSRVRSCVLDDPRLILETGGRAQARLPVDAADVNPVGLEPDAVVVDHTDNGDWYREEPGGKSSERARGGDSYLATSGDLLLATCRDFLMAMDKILPASPTGSTAAKYSSGAALRRCVRHLCASLTCSTSVFDNLAGGPGRRGRRFKSCHPDQCHSSLTCGNAALARGVPPPNNRDRGLEGTERNTREPQGKPGPTKTGRRTPPTEDRAQDENSLIWLTWSAHVALRG
jgi:hypothetical protein